MDHLDLGRLAEPLVIHGDETHHTLVDEDIAHSAVSHVLHPQPQYLSRPSGHFWRGFLFRWGFL